MTDSTHHDFRKAPMLRAIFWNAVIAAAYVSTGYLATLIAIPPGDSTIFWPPAGIAMSAAFLLGRIALPGVFVGAAAVVAFGFAENAASSGFFSVAVATLAIAAGSTLQALAGAWCFGRFNVAGSAGLDRQGVAGLTLSIAGVCLISSSLGIAALAGAGLLSGDRLLTAWSSWWLGDMVGIVLIAPIIVGAVRQSRLNAAVLALIMVLGITGVHVTSSAVRENAADVWQRQASLAASRLTSTTLLWLDLANAPVSSLAALFQNSEFVDDVEFFNAVAALEENEPDFFPASVAFAVSLALEDEDSERMIDALLAGTGRWEIIHTTDLHGQLDQGTDIAADPAFARAVAAAIQDPGKVVIGAFTMSGTESRAIAAVAVSHAERPAVIIGVIDLVAMLDGLFEVQVPEGASLQLLARGAGAAFDSVPVRVFEDRGSQGSALDVESQRAISGGASLEFRWSFSRRFLGGPGSSLADGIFFGGIMGTTGIVLFLGYLLRQNRRIREQVRARTSELADREKILRSAMDNMSDGMFMLDDRMRFVAFNDRYRDYMRLSDEIVSLGKPVEDAVRAHAARGDYGPGEPESQVRSRMEALVGAAPVEREMRLADGSKVFQLRKTSIEGGGAVVVVTDITGMTRAREELQKSERETRLTLDNMPGGICMLDNDLRIQVVNRTYCELYGHDPDVYAIGRPITEIIRQNVEAGLHSSGEHLVEDVDETVRRRIAALQSGVPGETERQLPGGRTLLIRHNPIEGGGVVLVATDISERKRAENRLSSIVETASDGIIVVDSVGTIMTFSPSAERIFGHAAPEVLGKNIRMLMPEPDRSAHDGYLKRYLDTREKRIVGSNREVTGLRKDGVSFAMDLAIGEASLGGETVFTGIIRDITERKRAQDTIRRQEERLRAIIDNIPLVIILKDSQGRYLTVNNYYEAATGVAPDSTIGLTDGEILPPETAEVIMDIDRRIMESKTSGRFEEKIPNPDGSLHDFLTTKVPILDRQGNVETLVVAALDITDRKVAERKLSDAYDVISSSIQYASRIQQAFLTGREMLAATMKDSFSLWVPRDVVGGDIFWCRPWGNDGVIVMAADCTGHGVPGAFMTLISAGALDRAVNEVAPGSLGKLVRQMHLIVQSSLNQQGDTGTSDDGLELSAAYIDLAASTLIFTGARLPLYVVENGEVTEIRGTRSGIGYRGISSTQQFDETVIPLTGRQSFYMATDGYIDQVGGERRRMLGKSRFKETLLGVQGLPFAEQEQRIIAALIDYQGEETRRDDVTVLGFRP
jgi:PAS domain S-box-containing protein